MAEAIDADMDGSASSSSPTYSERPRNRIDEARFLSVPSSARSHGTRHVQYMERRHSPSAGGSLPGPRACTSGPRPACVCPGDHVGSRSTVGTDGQHGVPLAVEGNVTDTVQEAGNVKEQDLN